MFFLLFPFENVRSIMHEVSNSQKELQDIRGTPCRYKLHLIVVYALAFITRQKNPNNFYLADVHKKSVFHTAMHKIGKIHPKKKVNKNNKTLINSEREIN